MPPRQALTLLSGTANRPLAEAIARQLGTELGSLKVTRFPDGETHALLQEDVRNATVCIVQPTCPPVNDHLIELAFIVDAARAAGAARIIGMVSYFGYAREERRTQEGECRSAQMVARLLAQVGLDRMITLDPHAPALESALTMPVNELSVEQAFLPTIQAWQLKDLVVVSPDAGGLRRAQRYANALDVPLAIAAKQRRGPKKTNTLALLGDVKNRCCLIVDDMVSTGRTLTGAAQSLLEAGACDVSAAFTHAVMSEGAERRISESNIAHFLTSDSVPSSAVAKIEVASVAPLFANCLQELVE